MDLLTLVYAYMPLHHVCLQPSTSAKCKSGSAPFASVSIVTTLAQSLSLTHSLTRSPLPPPLSPPLPQPLPPPSPLPLPPPVPHSSIGRRGTEVIEEQPEKAPSPRLVRPAGSAIDVMEEQP